MDVVKHRFTVEEFTKMEEAGILREDDRVELIDGEVVQMAPIGARHVESVMRLNRLLSRWTLMDVPTEEGAAYFVGVQNPIILGNRDEPQPDLVVVRRREGASGVPTPEEVLLVVEVADTSLRYDREVKLPKYAAAGIPEAWIVNLEADETEAYSEPGPEGYGKTVSFRRGQQITSATVPGLAFDAAEALPPEG